MRSRPSRRLAWPWPPQRLQRLPQRPEGRPIWPTLLPTSKGDPIFKAIEKHRQADANHYRVCDIDHGTDEEGLLALLEADEAASALLLVEPTSFGGVAALLAYFAANLLRDDLYFPPQALQDGEDVPYAAALALAAAAAVCKIEARALLADSYARFPETSTREIGHEQPYPVPDVQSSTSRPLPKSFPGRDGRCIYQNAAARRLAAFN